MPPLSEGKYYMPLPVFAVIGRVSCTDLDVNHNWVFNIDVSQYGAVSQQLTCLWCFCSYANTQDSKIPLPSKEKHVILHGYPIEFDVDHCVIHIVNMVLGPRVDLAAHSTDMLPPAKLGRFDWKGWKGKQARKDDNSKYDDDDAQW